MSKEKKPFYFRLLKFIVNFNWFAVLILSGLMSVFILIILVTGFEPNSLHVQIPVKIVFAEDEDGLHYPDESRPMIMDITGEASVLVERQDIPYLNMRLLFILVALTIYLFGSFHLRQFVKVVDLEMPFAPEIPLRLRYIGITLFIWGPFLGLAGYLQGKLTLENIKNIPAQLSIESDVHPEFIFAGLLLLLFSEIIKAGVKMQKEQSLTV